MDDAHRRTSMLGLVCCGLVLAGLLLAGPAGAALGDLTAAGCFSSGAAGCTSAGSPRLAGATGVASTPDGAFVYVASAEADSVTHFRRAANGDLTQAGCISSASRVAINVCNSVGTEVLDSAGKVALSGDGSSLYVVSPGADAISHFRRAPNGDLTLAGCISSASRVPTLGCTSVGSEVLRLAAGLAVSPDDASVYVTTGNDAVVHFRRAANGDLTTAGCISSASTSAANGCTSVGSEVLDGPFDVALSPGGESVYVTAVSGDSISHFRRAANGDLTAAGCISSASRSAANGCTSVGSEALDAAVGVALSANGASVYVASGGVADAVSHFRRAANGDLTAAGCISSASTSAANGCASAGSEVLADSVWVAISPDGASLYAPSFDGDAISHLRRAANGDLTAAGCISSASRSAANGCTSVGSEALDGPIDVVVSRDGASVYLASFDASTLSHFRRDLTAGGGAGAGGAPLGGGQAGGTAGVPVALAAFVGRMALGATRFRVAGRGGPVASAAQRRRRRAPVGTVVTYRLTGAGTVRFAVERTVSGRRQGRRCVKSTRRNRRARSCRRVEVLGSFTHAGVAGVNRFRFTGRLTARRALRPGRYTLAATTGSGAAQRTAFTVVRR